MWGIIISYMFYLGLPGRGFQVFKIIFINLYICVHRMLKKGYLMPYSKSKCISDFFTIQLKWVCLLLNYQKINNLDEHLLSSNFKKV